MKPEIIILAGIFAAFALAEALRTGLLYKRGQRAKDVIVEVIGSMVLLLVTQPGVLLCSGLLMAHWFPTTENILSDKPFVLQFVLLLIFDDMMQYWWHRASHTPLLYKLHRPHHDAPYMSVRIVYRNNIFYYALMPSLWFSGALIYMGLGMTYAVYLVIKLTIIYAAHSDVRWDEPLYKIPALSPVMWLVERIISTPSTHSAHHGLHLDDGITNYKGNFGNMLFLWDVLFGTAKITRRYPPEYGVENLHDAGVGEQLLWPLIPSTANRPAAADSAVRRTPD
ncbi:MAG: sterol desaturase family protein [Salinisphaeraceae bacterium]|nr:sterol desaturase family protein [Salinisphaeraceae bacterium]